MEKIKCIFCEADNPNKSYIQDEEKVICIDCVNLCVGAIFNFSKIPSRESMTDAVKEIYKKYAVWTYLIYVVLIIILLVTK
jgi:hypothetical protein